jgi:hypothetical protein
VSANTKQGEKIKKKEHSDIWAAQNSTVSLFFFCLVQLDDWFNDVERDR